MTDHEELAARLGRLVRQRRKGLKLTQAAVQEADGPSTATLRLIEGGKHTDFRPSTSEPLERILRWDRGSIDSILKGGDPTPIEPLPKLPRNAPNAPVLGAVDKALGVRPMTAADRQLLVSARNKLFHSNPTAFTDDETRVLTKFIEDDELRTLHVRIDWLPRAEQLEVSALVNDLHLQVEERWVADGYTNESEQLPDYAQPNPLPVEGVAPDLSESSDKPEGGPENFMTSAARAAELMRLEQAEHGGHERT